MPLSRARPRARPSRARHGLAWAALARDRLAAARSIFEVVGYVTSCFGAFVALVLVRHAIRSYNHPNFRKMWMRVVIVSGLSLGGASVWCQNFVGMSAISLMTCDGEPVPKSYSLAFMLFSLGAGVVLASLTMTLVMPSSMLKADSGAPPAAPARRPSARMSIDPIPPMGDSSTVLTMIDIERERRNSLVNGAVPPTPPGRPQRLSFAAAAKTAHASARLGSLTNLNDSALVGQGSAATGRLPPVLVRMSSTRRTKVNQEHWTFAPPCLPPKYHLQLAKFGGARFATSVLALCVCVTSSQYLGILSMAGDFRFEVDPAFAVVAFVVNVLASTLANFILVQMTRMETFNTSGIRALAACVLGMSVNGIHYSILAAVKFVHEPGGAQNVAKRMGPSLDPDIALLACLFSLTISGAQILWAYAHRIGFTPQLQTADPPPVAGSARGSTLGASLSSFSARSKTRGTTRGETRGTARGGESFRSKGGGSGSGRGASPKRSPARV